MRPIDADLIYWDSKGCGHPYCKQACENVDGQPCALLTTTYREVESIPTLTENDIIVNRIKETPEFQSAKFNQAHWIIGGWENESSTCSNCRFTHFRNYELDALDLPNYLICPQCGALMIDKE